MTTVSSYYYSYSSQLSNLPAQRVKKLHMDTTVCYLASEIIKPSSSEDKPILNVHSSDYAKGLMKHLELLGFAQE